MKKLLYLTLLFAALVSCKKIDPTLTVDMKLESSYVATPGAKYQIPFSVFSGVGTYQLTYQNNTSVANVSVKTDAEDPSKGVISFNIASHPQGVLPEMQISFTNGYQESSHTLRFEMEDINVPGSEESRKFNVSAEGGDLKVQFSANSNCYFDIPSGAKSWISQSTKTKAMVDMDIVLTVAPNTGFGRSAVVTLMNKTGDKTFEYTINQEGGNNVLRFTSNATTVRTPIFSGTGVEAHLFWPGAENYITMIDGVVYTKPFKDGEESHSVKIEVMNANSFKFTSLTGLTEIDLTEF